MTACRTPSVRVADDTDTSPVGTGEEADLEPESEPESEADRELAFGGSLGVLFEFDYQ